MRYSPYKLIPNFNPAYQGVDLHIVKDVFDGGQFRGREFCSEMVFSPLPEDMRPVQPPLRVSTDVLQEFMDALWMSGIRPSQSGATVGSLEATQSHLQDMRRLVEHTLKVSLRGE